MRKIFGGSLVFSLVGVALLGGIFAWTLSDSVESSNEVGEGDLGITFENSGNLLGPDGVEVWVGSGGAFATGDFDLRAGNESGRLEITSVGGNGGLCTVNMFDGRVWVVTPNMPIEEDPTFDPGDWEYRAYITTNGDIPPLGGIPANENCMGDTVNYKITVDAETIGIPDNDDPEDTDDAP